MEGLGDTLLGLTGGAGSVLVFTLLMLLGCFLISLLMRALSAFGVSPDYALSIGIVVVGGPVLLFSGRVYERLKAEIDRVETELSQRGPDKADLGERSLSRAPRS